jgi:diketogulonate reductase-like aldo/keto reductase
MTLTTKHFGIDIPSIGFGTWQLKEDQAHRSVKEALNAGYRHIDTAQAYENEKFVGLGLKDSGLPRDDYYLTTKVWTTKFHDGDLQESAKGSLKRLGVDEVDLLLLHWYNDDVPLEETIGALNDARKKGLTRHIGVSNFTTKQLDEAVKLSEAPIMVNQVEYHPFIDQTPLLEATRTIGTALTAYCPLAQGRVFKEPVIQEIARKHNKTEAQVTMRWFVQQPGVITIPRSSNPDHIHANNDIHDFALDADDMGRMNMLRQNHERIVNPDWAPDWDKPVANFLT